MRTACLLGNGVSLAYNAELRVDQLTADLLAQFEALGATDPERALAAYAANLAALPGEHFEELLGPLASTSKALEYLPGFAGLTDAAPDEVAAALQIASGFLRDIHRIGTAVTLDHIAQRTIGGNFWNGVWPVAEALIGLGQAHELSVGTLNYDGLMHSGFMEAGTDAWGTNIFPITDLADGRWGSIEEIEVAPGRRLQGHPLRPYSDMPADRAALIQLHGSLGWLRDGDNPGRAFKFNLPDLRDLGYWAQWRAGTTRWEPVVVLTDRKDTAVEGWPFSLAYRIFFGHLLSADRWMIAGYGLGDAPVNALFDAAVRERLRIGLPGTPPTLIAGYGEPSNNLRARAVTTLRLDAPAVVANTDGVPDVFASDAWKKWAAV